MGVKEGRRLVVAGIGTPCRHNSNKERHPRWPPGPVRLWAGACAGASGGFFCYRPYFNSHFSVKILLGKENRGGTLPILIGVDENGTSFEFKLSGCLDWGCAS